MSMISLAGKQCKIVSIAFFYFLTNFRNNRVVNWNRSRFVSEIIEEKKTTNQAKNRSYVYREKRGNNSDFLIYFNLCWLNFFVFISFVNFSESRFHPCFLFLFLSMLLSGSFNL